VAQKENTPALNRGILAIAPTWRKFQKAFKGVPTWIEKDLLNK